MREIKCIDIIENVKQLCIEAECDLPDDVLNALFNKKNEEDYLEKKYSSTSGKLITIFFG